MQRLIRSNAGLTLMEMMTVLVIISILAVLMLPLISHLRQRADHASCTQNLKGLHVAAANYVTDAKHWPQMDTKLTGKPELAVIWQEIFRPYGIAPINWVCPSAQRSLGNPDVTKPKFARIDYQSTPFNAEPMTPYKWPTQPWFAETGDFHGDGPLMIFCKGNVSSLKQFVRDHGTRKR